MIVVNIFNEIVAYFFKSGILDITKTTKLNKEYKKEPRPTYFPPRK